MERKIGEVFKIKNEWYQCIPAPNGSCLSCDLFVSLKACPILVRKCAKSGRTDKIDVIFKKLRKTGEPYASACPSGRTVYFQRYETYIKPIINDNEIISYTTGGLNFIDIEIEQNKEDMKPRRVTMSVYDKDYLLDRLETILHDNLCQEHTGAICDAFAKYISLDSQPKLKPFDLEAAKAGKAVCTRNGLKARILCFDKKGGRPIVALIIDKDADGNDKEEVYYYHEDGKSDKFYEYQYDLMMLTQEREG